MHTVGELNMICALSLSIFSSFFVLVFGKNALIPEPQINSNNKIKRDFTDKILTIMTSKPIQASAPGKVLILGGYVIVEQNNVGVSVGVNARFTTQLESQKAFESNKVLVHVQSPQFHQNYSFEASVQNDCNISVKQTEGPSSVFLYYAVLYTVAAAKSSNDTLNKELTLVLLADNDFYSQKNYLDERGLPVSAKNLRALPPHLPLVGDVSKTGLGSSAAMTTSVVACLYRAIHGPQIDLDHVHGIAQIAHSVAQKKVGSGFDVYTAVFGTCAYRRFSPEGVAAMLKDGDQPETVEVGALQKSIEIICSSASHTAFRLPTGIKLLLGDIHHGGSSTPGMVVKIMNWQKSVAAEPNNLWQQLKNANENYVKHLQQLIQAASSASSDYEQASTALQTVVLTNHTAQNPMEQKFLDAHQCALTSRRLLRQVGVEAGVPVEPTELTGLLDETAALPGVFATGCPGAGGYDAIFALVLGDHVAAAVEAFWESKNVCPLLVREDPHGLVIEGNE